MPKGDADNLRADLDDGCARVANLLLEALCCAPLTGTEYAVVLFIMRRTYGWAAKDRNRNKLDEITADEIATATVNPRSTVHKAVQTLVKGNVLLAESLGGNRFAYGMNTDVAQWGCADREWKASRTGLRENREAGVYNQKRSKVSPKTVRGLVENGQRYNQKGVEVGALSPTGTGADGASTDSRTDSRTDKGVKASTPPAGDVTLKQRTDTPAQAAANACLALWGLTHDALTGPQAGTYYKAMNALIAAQTGGAEEVAAWADQQQAVGFRTMGNGAAPEKAIPAAVRKEITAATWQAAYAGARAQAGPSTPAPFTIPRDRSTYLETKL